jgi:LPS sulfotransferase NodH
MLKNIKMLKKYFRQNTKKTRFVIIFSGRSGSTHLRSLLNNHPDIFCRDEKFHDKNKNYSSDRVNTIAKELSSVFSSNKNVVGFKFKFPEQHEWYPEVEDFIQKEEDIKIIFLYRKNIVKQAISKQNQLIVYKNIKDSNILKNQNHIKTSIFLDVNWVKDKAELIMRSYAFYYGKYKNSKNFIKICYEDLVLNQDKEMERIFNFLNVKPERVESHFQKITNDDLKNAVSNYEELKNGLNQTKFAQYLYKDNNGLPEIDELDTVYNNFDWERYLNFYSDLSNVYSSKKDTIDHWLKTGKVEGRHFFERISDTGKNNGTNIFFIRGFPRSGTNWVNNLLNLHPNIFARGEINLEQTILQYTRRLNNCDLFQNFFYKKKTTQSFNKFLRDAVLNLRIFSEKEKLYWIGERSPIHLDKFGLLAHEKTFYIFRDGRDVLVSFTYHLLKYHD